MNNIVKAEDISGWQQWVSASVNEYCVVAKGDQQKLQIFKATLLENWQ